jgi:peptidyl-prolyl cis-trans isomerase A (cyclophilin A)
LLSLTKIKQIIEFMKNLYLLLIAAIFIPSAVFGQTNYSKKDIKKMKLEKGIYANMSTTKGDILLKLEMDKTPLTVANFVGLAEGNFKYDSITFTTPYFDGLTFHRVIANFMIQGGDPSGNGSGGPGYKFFDEFDTSLTHSGPGILSMANAGPKTNGSQFFITHKATPHLNNKHSVFGHVIKGQNIIDSIEQNDTINTVTIYRIGKPAKKFNAIDVFSTKQSEYKIVNEAKIKKEKIELAIREAEVKKMMSMSQPERIAYFKTTMSGRYPNAKQTESGLMYIVDQEGEGESPATGQTVTVHYTGYFTNGDKFDSSVDRNQPFEFPCGQKRVISGWDEGITLMAVGSKFKLILPYWLGYGETKRGPIPAYSTLIFDVELISFK